MIKPTAVAKLFVTVLAVALLGLVFAAPGIAVEGTEEGGQAAPAEPDGQTEQPPADDGTQNQATPDDSGSGTDSSGGSAQPTQEEQARFDRYCNQPNASPSHSDAQFCEEFKKKFGGKDTGAGASSTGGPTQEEKDRYERYCTQKDAEPSHNDKKFCEDYEKKYPKEAKAEQAAANNEQATNADNEDAKKDDEPNSGPLAFTGLDIWQLVLLGLVLVGGGLGARKLLAN